MITYLLLFCRFTLLALFGLACVGKARHPTHFSRALRRLHLVPERLTSGLAAIIISSELLVVVCLARGATLLVWGFGLAALLLIIFSLGLLAVLRRDLGAPCACFGLSEKPISRFDIWRNLGSLLLALVGLALSLSFAHPPVPFEAASITVIGMAVVVYVLALTQVQVLLSVIDSNNPKVPTERLP